MNDSTLYTTKLGAGLGLVDETKTLLQLWEPGMTASQLHQQALESGRFPNITDRRLRNIVAECFAPRYLVESGAPARHLKRLQDRLSTAEINQLFLLFTSRANPILGDFIRQVYWERYAGGHGEISNDDAWAFVERAIGEGRTVKRWTDSTIQNVAGYLTGCCADYGLLARGRRTVRHIIPFRISPKVAAYLAHDLHFAGLGDNALLSHADWGLFGLGRDDVLDELKRLSLTGLFIVQSAGDAVRIGWKHKDMETVCDGIAQG